MTVGMRDKRFLASGIRDSVKGEGSSFEKNSVARRDTGCARKQVGDGRMKVLFCAPSEKLSTYLTIIRL